MRAAAGIERSIPTADPPCPRMRHVRVRVAAELRRVPRSGDLLSWGHRGGQGRALRGQVGGAEGSSESAHLPPGSRRCQWPGAQPRMGRTGCVACVRCDGLQRSRGAGRWGRDASSHRHIATDGHRTGEGWGGASPSGKAIEVRAARAIGVDAVRVPRAGETRENTGWAAGGAGSRRGVSCWHRRAWAGGMALGGGEMIYV